ncbi:polyprotein [aalivirus A1]|uniref:Genome polyprotein n=1 Tax=aalivirus A1 TaxID=1482734 RepID=X4YD30_9PICO|nr:polyprotein [aalivirus A1]AHV82114.1 polyprotein [aalivirus A1]
MQMESIVSSATTLVKEVVPDVQKELSDIVSQTIQTGQEGIVQSDASQSSAILNQEPNNEQTMLLSTDHSTDDFLSCSMSVDTSEQNPEKMIMLKTIDWGTTVANNKILARLNVPEAFLVDNTCPAWGQSKFFRFIRCGYQFRVTLTAPMGTAGLLVLTYMPPGYGTYSNDTDFTIDANSLLALPHAMLDIRCANEAVLTVPYMNYRNYIDYTTTTGTEYTRDGGQVIVWVLSQLRVGSSAGIVGVSLYGQMLDMDLQCPRLWDNGKKHARRKAVVPPPKPPVNHHVVVNAGPGCANLANGLSMSHGESAALVGESTSVDHTSAGSNACYTDLTQVLRRWTVIGRLSWQASSGARVVINTLNVILNQGVMNIVCKNYDWFRGSIEVKAIVVGSEMTAGRLQMSYFPKMTNGQPTLEQCRNSLYVVSDVGCGPLKLTIPFVSNNWRMQTSTTIGRLVFHVVNKLTHNSTAPSQVDIVVMARIGTDFQLTSPTRSTLLLSQGAGDDDEQPVYFVNYEIEKIPIQSESHTLVCNVFSRSYYYKALTVGANTVEDELLEVPMKGVLSMLRCFAYWSGELVLTVQNEGDDFMAVAHSYGDYTPADYEGLVAMGAIIIPPKTIKTVNVPFYSGTPLRVLRPGAMGAAQPAFGRLFMWSLNGTSGHLYISLRKPQLFGLVPVPTTRNSLLLTSEGATNSSLLKLAGDVEENPGPLQIEGKPYRVIQKGPNRREIWSTFTHNNLKVKSRVIETKGTLRIRRTTVQTCFNTRDLSCKPVSVMFRIENETPFGFDCQTMYDFITEQHRYVHYTIKKPFREPVTTSFEMPYDDPEWDRLLQAGDIEQNPGPDRVEEMRPYGKKITFSQRQGRFLAKHYIRQYEFNVVKREDILLTYYDVEGYWPETPEATVHVYRTFLQHVIIENFLYELPVRPRGTKRFRIIVERDGVEQTYMTGPYDALLQVYNALPTALKEIIPIPARPDPQWNNLQQAGDVEMNPGPEFRKADTQMTVDKKVTCFSTTVNKVTIQQEGFEVSKTVLLKKNTWFSRSHVETKVVYFKGHLSSMNVVDSSWTPFETKETRVCWVPQAGEPYVTTVVSRSGWFWRSEHFNQTGGWVPDLTQCGDVESNPGPWDPERKHFCVVGPGGVGKSHVANLLTQTGMKLFKEACSPGPVTKEQETREFAKRIITDTPCFSDIGQETKPKALDMYDCFVYVHQPGRFQKIEEKYEQELLKVFPNFWAHTVVVINFRGQEDEKAEQMQRYMEHTIYQKLFHKSQGRVLMIDNIDKIDELINFPPYHQHFAQLVYQNRGMYKHYGVKVGETVYHLNTSDIIESSLKGVARVQESEYSARWKPVDEVAYINGYNLFSSGAVEVEFNIDDNCDSWSRKMIGSNSPTQGARLKWCLSVAAAMAFISSMDMVSNESPGMFQRIITSISSHFYGNLENIVIRTVIRTVCRIVCYLILYCHSPNLLTTGVLVALIAMDMTSINVDPKIKAACESLANGEFAEFCSSIVDLTDEPEYVELRNSIPRFNMHARSLNQLQRDEIDRQYEAGMGSIPCKHPLHQDGCPCIKCLPPRFHVETDKCECRFCVEKFGYLRERNDDGTRKVKNQGPAKGFNEWTTAAKNIQWWVEGVMKCLKWIKEKLFPPNMDKILRELEIKSSEIATVMACADEHICKCRTDKVYVLDPKTRQRQQILVDKLSNLLSEELPSQLNHYTSKLNALMNRIQGLNLEPPLNYTHRPEPLGIWIQGEPGSGKSFLANFIVKSACERYGWSAYSQPIGSDHMDGYTDQEVHVFDDLGQNRDEEDMALMCNLISSVPFIVPKADLTSKGTTYNGRIVIVTTNKTDFTSLKLADAGALQRRFPIVLNVKPRQEYERVDSHQRVRFNAVNATMDGSLTRGECWDRNVGAPKGLTTYADCWVPLKPDIMLKEIFEELESRDAVNKFMNQGPTLVLDSDEVDEFDKFFPDPPIQKVSKIKKFIHEMVAGVKGFVERHRTWFVAAGALGTVLSLISFLIPIIRKIRGKTENDDESFYGGKMCPTKIKNYQVQMTNQGPVNMKPILKSLVNLQDRDGYRATGLAIGNKTVVTYGHDRFNTLVHLKEEQLDHQLGEPTAIRINGEKMDLVQYEVDCPFQFKSSNHRIYDGDYNGDGYLVWKEGNTYSYLPVSNIHATNEITTTDGTTTANTYTYIAKTWKGSCGSVLVGIVDGNPKILGIHIAGNKTLGCAARLFPMFNQGKVVHVEKTGIQYHQPRQTAYEPSPVNTGHSTVGPAVLSKNDKRLEVEVEDVTKNAAAKYIGNVFDPPVPIFSLAKAVVIDKIRRVVKPSKCMTYDEAISVTELPIDWQTSPGLKYKGRTKADLVQDPKFKEDVKEILAGKPTFFTTYLKDELRPIEKIASGNTRAIEAANFDHVVAWRQVMGNIVKQLFSDHDRVTGFAPGMNPYTHFDSLMDQVKWNVLALDFKKFDGSLSPQVMEEAVDILASFHDMPQMVKDIHKHTIYSTNVVSDETWFVEGGMCSGSPCTTVLNTICNLLVNTTILLSEGIQPDNFYIAAYGDDTIISVDGLSSSLPDPKVMQQKYKEWFGMTVTSADKGSEITWDTRNHVQFLKRRPGFFPGTQKVVGVLDLESMMEHIAWTKGSFQDQLNSFYQELVLHGEQVYMTVRQTLKSRAPQYNHPTFLAAYNIMKPIVMVY